MNTYTRSTTIKGPVAPGHDAWKLSFLAQKHKAIPASVKTAQRSAECGRLEDSKDLGIATDLKPELDLGESEQ